jgi:CDP-diacylglycerol--serine O-phosphatidyltransferase
MVVVPALLMVSTIRFRSFKTFDLQVRRSYSVLLLFALALALLAAQPQYLLVALAYTYLLSPVLELAWSRVHRRSGTLAREDADAVARDGDVPKRLPF